MEAQMVTVHYTVKRDGQLRGRLWDHTIKFESVKDAMRFIRSLECGGKKGYVLVGKPTLEDA
jgi:hypothetical protein